MASSPKSLGKTEIMKPSDSSLALVSVASPSTIILMSEDGAHVVSLNGPLSSPTIAENHSSDLLLVLLHEASSKGESREHATFRVALDGSANWSSVSRNHFFPSSSELFLMAPSVTPIPLSIDTSVEIPLANLVPTKGKRRLRALNRKVQQTRQKCHQAEIDLASALAASKRTRASVASPVSSSCSLSGSNVENPTQSNPSASSAQLERIIYFHQQSVL
ncbi:hypothetical protein KY290_001433 [Solanum tuberosum]|uniref:Uncharacterized protein n=1 Tax=Solanum tuberosum TaxID=4113 RepID=A0ABQ7WMN3_SOLTU|nr:hypothetical protein KY285_001343 [Solanum tuberosum]KAH0781835.1 hypothetical protein KY290_001433 [Solanum tuberosum]